MQIQEIYIRDSITYYFLCNFQAIGINLNMKKKCNIIIKR